MLDAAALLSELDEVNACGPDDWDYNLDTETVSLVEGDAFDRDPAYGWTVSQHVRTLTCTSGGASMTCYPARGADLKAEALRCVRAVEAYWADPPTTSKNGHKA